MARACSTGLHSPSTHIVRNQGFEFSQCRHCARDLIRSNRRWRTVPNGFRIVWREADLSLAGDISKISPSVVVWRAEDGSIWHPGAMLGMTVVGFFYLVWTIADRLCESWTQIAARSFRPRSLRLPAA